jgi:hypothetical protein
MIACFQFCFNFAVQFNLRRCSAVSKALKRGEAALGPLFDAVGRFRLTLG